MAYRLDIIGQQGAEQTFDDPSEFANAIVAMLDQGNVLQVETIPDAEASSPTQGPGDTPPQVNPAIPEGTVDDPITDAGAADDDGDEGSDDGSDADGAQTDGADQDATSGADDDDDASDTDTDDGTADSAYVNDDQG